MLKLHQYGIMSSPTTAQFAAIEALRNGEEDIRMMVDEYNRRRRYIYNGLKSLGIESFEPQGAFYIFPKIGGYGMSGEEFCNRLLYDYKCAIVPGTAFGKGGEEFARISYAYSIKHITQALERLEAFVKTL
jgi:aminotransferase